MPLVDSVANASVPATPTLDPLTAPVPLVDSVANASLAATPTLDALAAPAPLIDSVATAPVLDTGGSAVAPVLDSVPAAAVARDGRCLLRWSRRARFPPASRSSAAGLPIAGAPPLDTAMAAGASVFGTTPADASLVDVSAPVSGAVGWVPGSVTSVADAGGSSAAAIALDHTHGSLAAGMAADHGAAVSANVATAAHAGEGTLAVGSNASLTSSLDELPGALIEGATNPTVILTAGMMTFAGLTAVGRGPGLAGCASSAQLLFTNVRLIPCLAVESVSQTVSQVASAAAGRPRVLRVSPPPALAGAVGVGDSGHVVGAGLAASAAAGAGEDGRLMAQLGIALAALYAAFLTAWFSATRLRWNRHAVTSRDGAAPDHRDGGLSAPRHTPPSTISRLVLIGFVLVMAVGLAAWRPADIRSAGPRPDAEILIDLGDVVRVKGGSDRLPRHAPSGLPQSEDP